MKLFVLELCLILGWDYGLHADICKANPLNIKSIEWSAEGYQLWLLNHTCHCNEKETDEVDNILQLDFVKSTLSVNPSMVIYIYKLNAVNLRCHYL